jgi:CubicO group peptidase (beta-lactamase class C family)
MLQFVQNFSGNNTMIERRRTILGLALAGSMSGVLGAPKAVRTAGAAATSVLDSELAAIAADPACELASLSVIAIRNGKRVYEHQFGQRVLGLDGATVQPATPRTMYRIASISKMMTTLGVMKLIEDGKLSLDSDIGDDLGFPVRNPAFPTRMVTLRMLLTHTSSLRDAAGYSWSNDKPLKSVLVPGEPLFGKGEMWDRNAAPGAYFTYCNLNWGVIGTLMERVTGERFDLLMQRLLLAPLGLHGGYNPAAFSPEDLANVAVLYRKRPADSDTWNPAGPWVPQVDNYGAHPPVPPAGIEHYVIGANATPFSPTGGLRISAHDMGTVMLMLINDGRHDGRVFLKPATLKLMFTRQWTYDGKGGNGDSNHGVFNAWGLGNQQFPDQPDQRIALVDGGGFPAVGHLGDAYGLVSLFVVDLARKNGMVALIDGSSSEPEAFKGVYSALPRVQETIMSALHRRAILGRAD